MILGGPMNAEDDVDYPDLKRVVRLVQMFGEHKSILGIGLGAHLIARALGKRAKLGFTPLRRIKAIAEIFN